MTDELRHDSSVQETQIAHYRRQPPRAPRWGRAERAPLDRQHPSEPTQDAVIERTQPWIPTLSSPEGPEPKSGPQEERTASSNHHLLPVKVRARHTQSKISETKNWDQTQSKPPPSQMWRAETHTDGCRNLSLSCVWALIYRTNDRTKVSETVPKAHGWSELCEPQVNASWAVGLLLAPGSQSETWGK